MKASHPASSGEAVSDIARGRSIATAILGGIAFGFLLQKGGVGKYHVLVGQLLLQDFTVVKVMLSAIITGMVGVHFMARFGKARLQLPPTRVAAQANGGLLFGLGFGLVGYCPGTAAVALGQGSWDALFGMAGLVAGSYLFAEFSAALKRGLGPHGSLGRVTLPDLLHLPRLSFALATAILLAVALALLHRAFPK